MSKEIKEAIELIEKAHNMIIAGDPVGYSHHQMFEWIDQALTKLREAPEQPPAGEFTKLARKAIVCLSLAEADEKGNIKDEKGIESSIEVLFRACDRLDTETQRADKAEAELRKWREKEYCEDCNAKTVLSTGDIGCKSKKYIKDLEAKLKTKDELLADRLDAWWAYIQKLKAKLKAKDELLFAYESVKAPVNPLLSIQKDLLTALEEIRDLETDCCPRCEGNGRLYADGKAHLLSENADTIFCGNCGGSGRILPENAQDIAEAAIAKAKKQGD